MRCVIFPMNGAGHLNACSGFGSQLAKLGHEVTICLAKNLIQLMDGDHGLIVELYDDMRDRTEDPLLRWGEFMCNVSDGFRDSPLDQLESLIVTFEESFVEETKEYDDRIGHMIRKLNPDMIFVDFYTAVPSVIKSGIPWALIYSCNPLWVYEDLPEAPPAFSGLSKSDPEESKIIFRNKRNALMKELKEKFNAWLSSKEIDVSKLTGLQNGRMSSYLNIYAYPEDLDYREIGPVPSGWHRLDHMLRPTDHKSPLGIDENFLQKKHQTDRIVYFALGSMGASDVGLMKRLVNILAKSKHRFIVSKGPFHDQFELPSNMIGAKYLNQLRILPSVDLAINHGGNNSFLETLYHGKPMILMPLFDDQHDNGRRVEEKCIGRCLYPYKVSEEELLNAVDTLLNDKSLQERVKKIGEKMRNTKSYEELDYKLNLIFKQD
ncbi:demethyllactenocin mycarosyltransferase-like [Brevipalpus obovatus]|uniref:demethyllactenocin mycarosyltransferase-like n=1 Tax=Brevipalpus obovatus TaxID=246614 RepID=UPI003D9EA357